MERLIGAILLKAIEDWDNPEKRLEVEKFVESEWFNILVEGLHMEPDTIRSKFRTETFQQIDIRAAYR